MVKKTKKEPEPKKEVIPEVEPQGVNIDKITELVGNIEDLREWLRISRQYDIHRVNGAQVMLEKLENELKSYK